MKIIENVDLKKYSYIKIGGIAQKMFFPENTSELLEIIEKYTDFYSVGNCTNILFGDYFEKPFINLCNTKKISRVNELEVCVDAGVRVSELIVYMRENGLSGIEELAGIPGTIGGLTAMNGGAYGKEIFDYITKVEVVSRSGQLAILDKKEIDYKYRDTDIKRDGKIVTKVFFKFETGFKWEKMLDLLEKRKLKQPLEYPNIGSIFKNPPGKFAAQLIENLGLKGLISGDAQISEKHANFIVNRGNANFNDVITLIEKIKKDVEIEYKIILEEEIEIWKGETK